MPSLKAMAREAQKKTKAGLSKQAPNRMQTVFKSTERVADSDLESETESESGSDSREGSVTTPASIIKLNGEKPNLVASSTNVRNEEEEDDEVESDGEVDAMTSGIYGGTSKRGVESESESSQDADSHRESDEEHGHDMAGVVAEKTSRHMEEELQATSDTPRVIPTYNPPDGFSILSESPNGRQNVAKVLGQSNMIGKQLWYITAPMSVPISAVKQVSLQDVQLGKPALSLGGLKYGFVQDQAGEMDFTKVLVPEGNHNAYRVGQKDVDQTLHLQQIVELHNITKKSSIYSASSVNTKSHSRKQPKGLKMRFRPIGFGYGKTETIGIRSSSSEISSSTDSDANNEAEDAPPVSWQPVDLHKANARLFEHASKATESQNDSSSSGDETEDPPPVTPADLTPNSNSSSETSNDEMEDVPKSVLQPKKSSSSPPRSLKRKLSDFEKDHRTPNTLNELFKANGMPLKMSTIKNSGPVLAGSAIKVDGNANINEETFTTSQSMMTQALSLRASEIIPPSHSGSSKRKINTILPPQKSAILPPGRGTKLPNVPGVMTAVEARPETLSIKGADTLLSLEKKSKRSPEDRVRSIDPALSEKGRKKEMRQLKRNEASHISKDQRKESIKNTTSNTLARSINASSPSRNDWQRVLEARHPTKLSADKALSQDSKPALTTGIERNSKTPVIYPSNSKIRKENGGTPGPSHEASNPILSLGKGSVILPPKFARSLSR